MFEVLEPHLQPICHDLIRAIGVHLSGLDEPALKARRAYFQQETLDLTNLSPGFRRAWDKPFGYAGDFWMMELLYKGLRAGATPLERMVNSCLMSIPLGQAVRNRAWYMRNWIAQVAGTVVRPQIMSLACGPCEEVRLFLRDYPRAEADFYLVDQDKRALSYAREQVSATRASEVHFLCDSVKALIKEPARRAAYPALHLIYSGGLYDYLPTAVATRLTSVLYDMLAPGGVLVVGNFIEGHPFGFFIESASDWFLLHRTPSAMLELSHGCAPTPEVRLEQEPAGVNLFLCLRKPGGEPSPNRSAARPCDA